MSDVLLTGIPPGDELHCHYGQAIGWLKVHWRSEPRHMVAAIASLTERIDDLEAANSVASQQVDRAEDRAANAEHHVARLRTELARLKTRLIENGVESHESGS